MCKKISNSAIDKVGTIIKDKTNEEYAIALEEVNEWRMLHQYPLDFLEPMLKKAASSIDMQYIYSQRLKRIESIVDKVSNRANTIRLSKMQDIGGSRVILANIENVYKFYTKMRESANIEIIGEKDYIKTPRESGYRSIHLVIRHSDSKQRRDGLLTELQIRTQLEHIWATAVETAGIAIGHELKFGRGDRDWLDMFAHMSKIMANDEGADNDVELYRNKIMELNQKNDFIGKLEVLKNFTQISSEYITEIYACFLLNIDSETKKFSPIGYKSNEYEFAYARYKELENEGKNVVLVKTNSAFNLKNAYPNYFADMSQFLNYFENLLS